MYVFILPKHIPDVYIYVCIHIYIDIYKYTHIDISLYNIHSLLKAYILLRSTPIPIPIFSLRDPFKGNLVAYRVPLEKASAASVPRPGRLERFGLERKEQRKLSREKVGS